MDALSFLIETQWRYLPGTGVSLIGLLILTNGLFGSHGMLRRGIGMLARIEGWRLSVLGLAITGLGVAWMWESKVFFFLSLGIGFTELREASSVITALNQERGGRPAATAGSPSAKSRHDPASSSSFG